MLKGITLRLSPLLRSLGLRVPWTFEEIQQEWFGGPYLLWDPEDVEAAFNLAAKIRGQTWVVGNKGNTTVFPAFPGIGRRGGYSEFLRVYWFGKRMAFIVGATGAEDLIARVIRNDEDANEEASAIHLLRSRNPETELEIEPGVRIGTRNRKPDFRIRLGQDRWVYVEVTKLHRSSASSRVHELLDRLSDHVMALERPFLIELLLNRELTDTEEEELLTEARRACEVAGEHRTKVADFATILVKSGDPAVVAPSLIPDDARPRMAISKAIVGPGQRNRQIVARVPFADPRAEEILRYEARQLPEHQCGLLMVNVNSQPTAFESWSERIPQRFTPEQHTRVAGVILFMHATSPTDRGAVWVPFVRLISNPHASVPLPLWITDLVTETREDTRCLTSRPD